MIKLGKLKNEFIPTQILNEGENSDDLIVYGENIDTNKYDDITSPSNWLKYSNSFGKDYKWLRARLQDIGVVDDITWNSYNVQDKKILCLHKATSDFYNRARTVLTEQELNNSMTEFDQKSNQSRRSRYSYAKSIILNNVSELDGYLINNILKSDNLESDYISHGIEGFSEGDPIEALFSFIEGRTVESYGGPTTDAFGNPLGKYSTTGIATRSLTMKPSSPFTQSDMVLTIMDCLRNGNY